jgi:phosphonate transport system substrate-binding protein
MFMKRQILAMIMVLLLMSSCTNVTAEAENIVLEEIVFFANPVSDSDYSQMPISAFSEFMVEQLAQRGYSVGEFRVQVASSQLMVAEAIVAGSAHMGMVSAPNYIAFNDEGMLATLITKKYATTLLDVESTLSNRNFPGQYIDGKLMSYDETFLLVGSTSLGQELLSYHMQGLKIPVELIKKAKFCVQAPTNVSTYIYVNAWLQDQYGLSIKDQNLISVNNAYEIMAGLSGGSCDVAGIVAESWLRFESTWNRDFTGAGPMWEELSAIVALGKIPYSVIAFTENEVFMDEALRNVLTELILEFMNTESGQQFFGMYGIQGIGLFSEADEEVFAFTERAINAVRNNE